MKESYDKIDSPPEGGVEVVSLLLPTRGRVEMLARMIQSVAETASHPEAVEVVLYVDDDDTETAQFSLDDIRLKKIIGPRASMGTYNSKCFEKSEGDIIVLANDDIVLRTKGWDNQLRSVHRRHDDQVYLAYPNDLFKGRKLSTFPVMARSTCMRIGDPFPRAFKGAFIDYHILDIFERLRGVGLDRIYYLEDVVFEHLHFRTGKSEMDETYQSRDRFGDDAVFLFTSNCRREAARRLLEAIRHYSSEVRGIRGGACVPSRERLPGNPFSVLGLTLRQVGFDSELRWRWRFYLVTWFFARAVVRLLEKLR